MATLADSVIGIAQDTNKQVAGAGADALQAFHIASTAEHARQELEMERQKQEMNKATWLHSQLDTVARMEDGKVKNLTLDSIKKQAQQIYPDMNPDNFEVLKHKPEMTPVVAGILSDIVNGKDLSPEKLAQVPAIFGSQTADFNSFTEKARQEKMQMMGNQLKADSMNMRGAAAAGQLDEKKNQNATAAGQSVEKDDIIKNSKKNLNSLMKSSSILVKDNGLVTAKDLALAYNDYINATAPGGAATEGKVSRELPETWEQEWNVLKQKAGATEDIRKTPAGAKLIAELKANILNVKRDMHAQILDQFNNIADNYKSNTNPRVQQTIATKRAAYVKAYASGNFGDVAPAPASGGGGGNDDLHADLSKMTTEELKAWTAKHGG